MRTFRAVLALVLCALTSCVGSLTTPSATPTATLTSAPSVTPGTTTAAPVASPTPRQLRPFERVVPISVVGESIYVAADRERVAYVGATGELNIVDVAARQTKKVHTPPPGWHVDLDPHGLRGSTLVFRESRTDGQRTDVRIGRIDLRSEQLTTLDEFSGPFLGGSDNWQARAPITNGVSVAWVRVDDDRRPFGIHVVLQLAVQGAPRAIQSGPSAVWIDLEDSGRVLISTLISPDQLAELVVWRDGERTSLGTRPSADGGPAVFVAGRVFWGVGPRISRPSLQGALIDLSGRSEALDLGCSWFGETERYLVIGCQGAGTTLVEALTGARTITGFGQFVGRAAIAWREGGQWWLGILAP